MSPEQRAAAKDAYHYALAAAGADSAVDVGRRGGPGAKTEALRFAVAATAKAGLHVAAPKRPSRSGAYAERIRSAALVQGVDAYTGELVTVQVTVSVVFGGAGHRMQVFNSAGAELTVSALTKHEVKVALHILRRVLGEPPVRWEKSL